MNWLDIVIFVSVGFVALVGWRMGGVQIGVTGGVILAGIALSSRLHNQVSPVFSRFMSSDNAAEIAGFVAVFIVALLGSVAVAHIIRSLLGTFMLGWLDKSVGLGLGVIVTFAVGSAALSAVQSYPVLGLEDTIEASAVGSFLANNFDTVLKGLRFIPNDLGV